ncbi:MAG: hypothetical protein ABSE82_00350 [Nitrososphaerales archaeon]|jgi:hypothetical protein
MKPLHPLFFLLLFANVTLVLPIVTNGLRVLYLWYSPMANSGQASFFYPFVDFVAVCAAINIVAVFLLKRANWERFIALGGQQGWRSIVRGVLNDRLGRAIFLAYAPLYFVSFLVTSGLLLVPNLNVSSSFVPLTQIVFQGNGVPMLGPLALNVDFLALGIANTALLSLALIFGYYINCLTYVSQRAIDMGVSGSVKLAATQSVGGFLATTAPTLATTTAICCLTPTGMNSLLYLISTSSSILSKKIVWSYGTIAGAFWITGLLQGIELFSTMAIGIALLGLSYYQVRRIQRSVTQRRVLTLH